MATPLQDQVLNALKQVDDPDLHRDIVTLGMVRDLVVDESNRTVNFRLVLTTPACPLKDVIRNACVTAIHMMAAKDLKVHIEMDAEVTRKPVAAGKPLSGVKNLVAVASGKGGVGKSTVAVNLAVAMAQTGAKVGLVDADVYGPSIPIMMGLRGKRPGIEEGEGGKMSIHPFEVYGVKVMSVGLLVDEKQALAWRGPMISTALRQLLGDVAWGDLDYLFVDMPPGTGDIYLTLVKDYPVAGAVLVTTPQEVAMADTRKTLSLLRMPELNVPLLGVVENMAYMDTAGGPVHPFGQGGGQTLASDYDMPLLAQLPLVAGLAQDADRGMPSVIGGDPLLRSKWMDLAGLVAQRLSQVHNVGPEDQAKSKE